MNRNYLKGEEGDKINAILAGCDFNIRKLLRDSDFCRDDYVIGRQKTIGKEKAL